MPITVVNKIIIGFALFGGLLLITSVLSYLGLTGIQSSAEDVIEDKMPIQTRMNDVNTQILTLATFTANGYHEESIESLKASESSFESRSDAFIKQLDELSQLLGKDQVAEQAIAASRTYVAESKAMLSARKQQLMFQKQLVEQTDKALTIADEASALMLDLSFLDSNDSGIETIIGIGNNIDNKLLTLNTAINEVGKSADEETTSAVEDDLSYQLSNLSVDKEYLNRLADSISTDGIVDKFNEQYVAFLEALNGEQGLVWMQRQKLAYKAQGTAHRNAALEALTIALENIETLYERVNSSTLTAQQKILDTVMGALVTTAAVFVVGLIAAVLLAVITTRSIVRPLVKINQGLSLLSEGDLTRKLDQSGKDEFAALAAKINTLTDSLRNLVGNILSQEHRLDEVTKSSVALGEESLKQHNHLELSGPSFVNIFYKNSEIQKKRKW